MIESSAETISFSQMHHDKKIKEQQTLKELSYEQSINMKSDTNIAATRKTVLEGCLDRVVGSGDG